MTQWNKPADLNVTDYDQWLSHITYDGMESGKQIGDALAEAIGGSGGIIALQGILDTGAAKDRFAGLEESLAANPDVELLDQQTANFSRAEALEVTKTLLTKHGDKVKGIWAANDDMALGALEALKAAGRTEVAVVGIDAVPDALTAIKDGTMTATVSSDGPWQGGIGLAIGYCVATGELAVDDIADDDRAFFAEQFLIQNDNVADFADAEDRPGRLRVRQRLQPCRRVRCRDHDIPRRGRRRRRGAPPPSAGGVPPGRRSSDRPRRGRDRLLLLSSRVPHARQLPEHHGHGLGPGRRHLRHHLRAADGLDRPVGARGHGRVGDRRGAAGRQQPQRQRPRAARGR